LKGLGHERAWVVHGDGMDEVTTTGVTQVAELKDGTVRRFEITPEDAGLDRASIDELRGGDAGENAEALRRLLDGEKGPYRDIVLMGSAAALMMAGKVDALTEGVAMAADAIDSGGAKEVLAKLVRITTARDGE
jgi:anthranilate phosphoribosyltransferase